MGGGGGGEGSVEEGVWEEARAWEKGRVGVCEDGRECCGMEEVHVSRA